VTLTYDLDFQSKASYGYDHTQMQVQRLVGAKDRVKTNGHTDATDLIDLVCFLKYELIRHTESTMTHQHAVLCSIMLKEIVYSGV